MAGKDQDPQGEWEQLRPDALLAIRGLADSLEVGDIPTQELLDLYVYSKRVVAEVMGARFDMEFPGLSPEFHRLREDLSETMVSRYGGSVPAPYLVVPYGSKVHEKLFHILLQRFDTEVPAGLLRVPTRDSVHTERRVRELRELGLDIDTKKHSGIDTYRLCSLNLDFSLIPKIIFNTARDKKHSLISRAELEKILKAG
ncbi:hypothetical protein OHB24_39770 [Kribbella sp. NBC_00482]|uniref:hypothetical protein n=1 Tax=Kribbella sp. NBC_00482 TaxID=2975968 RepID=UPI002E19F9C1